MENITGSVKQTTKTFMEKLNTQYQLFVKKLDIDHINWREIGSYMVVGFVVGFLSKRYLRSLILIAIIIVVALKGLEYYHWIDINWVQIQQVSGLHGVEGMQGAFDTMIALVRNNLTVAISSLIGFVIGYKIG